MITRKLNRDERANLIGEAKNITLKKDGLIKRYSIGGNCEELLRRVPEEKSGNNSLIP